ncbi:MAG: TauD/TfdA family dioxygenase [Gammaproteobacteria bacterium]|nr:TauD/TfdA family dioxygenase [Gammaproteobacteria bacterium]
MSVGRSPTHPDSRPKRNPRYSVVNPPENSPFDPAQETLYQAWRQQKLQDYPKHLEELTVTIEDPLNLSKSEYAEIMQRLRKTNMVVYATAGIGDSDKNLVRSLADRFGLERLDRNRGADEDAISSLKVQPDAFRKGYIPYTTRPIAWHTDGYYNDLSHQILGMVLHCVKPASKGGANQLLDHEIAYLKLRDQNPAYIESLMHPEAMTIPANTVNGKELRPDRSGPVFRVLPGGQLHMRYTDRSRSIIWRDDPLTQEAVSVLKQLLRTDTPYHFEGKLQAGQGIICNNVLHTRSGFEDEAKGRLLFRARYYDRITDT